MNSTFTVREAAWHTHRVELQAIRRAVFVVEQRVPEELEWDEADARCHHVLAFAPGDEAIGTGRLLPDGHIGRMAVLAAWRGRGAGSAILNRLLELARQKCFDIVRLHAQSHALGFYAKHGFAVTGDELMEAGIPHRAMTLRLGSRGR
jgi:predicted GNAT family N-acyltransferase